MPKLPEYSKILCDEFEIRRARNKRYSIRAFAQMLNVSHGTLSLLLRGKVGLSQKLATAIAEKLAFTPAEIAYFIDITLAGSRRSSKGRSDARARMGTHSTRFNARKLDGPSFQLISEWYSFPIMELVRMYGPLANAKFLAKRLSISEANAISTLKNFNTLGIIKDDQVTTNYVSTNEGLTDLAVKEFLCTLMDKSKACLFGPVERSHTTAQVLRMRKADLDWAANELLELRRKLVSRLESDENHDSVFSVAIQWTRLDNDEL